MNSTAKTSVTVTPVKEPKSIRSKLSEMSKKCENSNPNLTTPSAKLSGNSTSKSVKKSPKSVRKSPNFVNSKIRERRFVVAKKNSKREKSNSSCKCLIKCKSKKCASVAYQTLRASQEGFFKSCTVDSDESKLRLEEEEEEIDSVDQNFNQCEENCGENKCLMNNGEDESGVKSEIGSGTLKRRRDRLLEEARQSVPESGRVMHLVKAFEKLLSIPKSKDSHKKNKEAEDTKKGIKWALPGLQLSKAPETEASTSSFCPSDFVLTSESLGLDSLVSSSLNSSQGSYAVSSRILGGRRSRRNSLESTDRLGGRNCMRMQRKVTSQKPFRLRTEQRGRCKEEQFIKKVQEKLIEEEKQRIPIAQGLPWTTDEPERLAKPPVKESTKPVDLVLHSDVRAVERAEFDNQVAEKMSLIEQYRMEMERQQKLEEEEEIRRLRKELVPRAQPMPYFDRPFIPRRSEKPPTIPKEPKFHIPQHKKIKSCMSWNDTYSHLGVQL